MYTEEERRIAEAVYALAREHAAANPAMKITKDYLFKLGQLIWPFSYRLADDDAGAARALLERANEGVASRHSYWTLLASELLLPQNQIVYSGSALWCHQGFPQIVMGHKYAAALMATKLSHDVAEQVRPPWRAFYIEVPRDLLFVDDNLRNQPVTVTGILVASMYHPPSGANRWAWVALTESQATLWQHGATTEHMLGELVEGVWEGTGLTEKLETLDKRCSTMINRLILNVCLAMSDPANVKAPKDPKPKKKGKHNERVSSEPRIRTYQLGTTPRIDCREAVSTYMRTGKTGAALNVQVMVAGHWRNVPYGPKSELRRVQWIEPHWRGPDDAPILVKATKVRP
jgi:hypothetical protein